MVLTASWAPICSSSIIFWICWADSWARWARLRTVGDHREAASGLAGAGGFDGGVEGEQVGLLGDALDHFEDLADVHRAAVEGLDVGAAAEAAHENAW